METKATVNRFIAKAAAGTFLLRMFYTLSAFGTTFLLTRWLGAEGLGIYNFVISWVVLIVIFVKCGFEDYLTRELAVQLSDGNQTWLAACWRFARGWIFAASVIAMTITAAAVSFITFEDSETLGSFWVGIFLIPILAFIGIYRGYFRASKRIIYSQVPEFLLRPITILICAAMFLLIELPASPQLAMGVNVLATILALVYCMIAASRHELKFETQETSSEADDKVAPNWLAGALPFLLIAGIHVFNQRTDRLMLGAIQDMESVGYYSVAIQMALIVNFPLLGITAAVAPMIAEGPDAETKTRLEDALVRNISLATLASVGIIAGMWCFAPMVLGFFGKDFSHSYVPMLILACGQLVNVASGPAGAVLSMSNYERIVAWGVFASAILNIVLNWFLIPLYGVNGAAIATAVSMAFWNILLVVMAKIRTGISSNIVARLLPSFSVSADDN